MIGTCYQTPTQPHVIGSLCRILGRVTRDPLGTSPQKTMLRLSCGITKVAGFKQKWCRLKLQERATFDSLNDMQKYAEKYTE